MIAGSRRTCLGNYLVEIRDRKHLGMPHCLLPDFYSVRRNVMSIFACTSSEELLFHQNMKNLTIENTYNRRSQKIQLRGKLQARVICCEFFFDKNRRVWKKAYISLSEIVIGGRERANNSHHHMGLVKHAYEQYAIRVSTKSNKKIFVFKFPSQFA